MDNDSVTIKLVDQIGIQKQTLELVVPKLQLTVRELIRLRVYNEFTSAKMYYETASQQVKEIRMGIEGKAEKQFVWMDSIGKINLNTTLEAEADKACHNFQNNLFIIIAGGKQLENLDDELILDQESTVKFIKLLPLVGG